MDAEYTLEYIKLLLQKNSAIQPNVNIFYKWDYYANIEKKIISWNILVESFTTGIIETKRNSEGVWTRIPTTKLKLSDISYISFNNELCIIPLPFTLNPLPIIYKMLCVLSEDYQINHTTTNFWYLQHISTGAIVGVIRHEHLMTYF